MPRFNFNFTLSCRAKGPTENRQGEWAPWLNIIIIIIIIIIFIIIIIITGSWNVRDRCSG